MRLYCYDGDVENADNPHAVQIELSAEDLQRRDDVLGAENIGPGAIGRYVAVTDQQTGERWEVASAPCGLGCHCGAIARRLAGWHGAD